MTYQSKVELKASAFLSKFNIKHDDSYFNKSFTDADGASFNARKDFSYGAISIEVKDDSLNGKKTKAMAEKAMNRLEPHKRIRTFNQISHQWNHAAAKQAIVQTSMGPASFMLLFMGKPNAATIKRCNQYELYAFDQEHFPKAFHTAKLLHLLREDGAFLTCQS